MSQNPQVVLVIRSSSILRVYSNIKNNYTNDRSKDKKKKSKGYLILFVANIMFVFLLTNCSFDSHSTVAQSVMNRRQEIGGCLLKLEPFRQTVPYQVSR